MTASTTSSGPAVAEPLLPAAAGEPPRSDDDGAVLPGLGLVFRRVSWLAAAAAIGLAAGTGAGYLAEEEYASTALLSITSEDDQGIGSLTQAAQALARVATSDGVVGPALAAATRPTGDASPPRLSLTVEAAPNAPLISVVGHASDPEEAQRVSSAVVSALAEVEVVRGYDVVVVAEPTTPTQPTRPGWLLPAGGATLGAALALVCAATVPERRRPV